MLRRRPAGILDRVSVAVTTTGGAGSATGSATATVIGAIVSVALDYHASAPATTDVTISQAAPLGNVLVVTNNASDATYAPRASALVTSANAAITNSFDQFRVNGPITVSVAQSNALDPAVVATLTILR